MWEAENAGCFPCSRRTLEVRHHNYDHRDKSYETENKTCSNDDVGNIAYLGKSSQTSNSILVPHNIFQ